VAKVSILMNAYNAEKYLEEAIDSVYAQTFKDWEIIFVDNCSTDNTKKLLNNYDNKIKYYKTDRNVPLGSARNFGLQHCKSEYIAFLDTDDIWLEDKLEKQTQIMEENNNYQLCYGGVIYINEASKIIGTMIPKAKSGNVLSQQFKRYEINMQSVLLRNRDDVKFNEKLRHSPDFDLFMEIASVSNVYVIKEPIVKYRKLKDSLTSKNIDVWWLEMKYTLDRLFDKYPELKDRYPNGYKMAYAKVSYNKARYLISLKHRKEASKELSSFKFVNIEYFILFLISFFPLRVWNTIHKGLK